MSEPMFPTTSMLDFQISTVISMETTMPYVVLQLNDLVNGTNVATMQMSPHEAGELGVWLIEAAQAAISESLMVVSMRANKIPEETIADVLTQMRVLHDIVIQERRD